MRNVSLLWASFGALILSATPLHLHAQATSSASKSADISVFSGYQIAKPDFGPFTNTGGTVGMNFTRYFHLPVAPSLEVRGNYNSGQSITEKSLLGGLRLQKDYRRYHPYVDFLFGGGTLHFASNLGPNYGPDRGRVISYGGGVDIDIIRHFQAKLDIQRQSWTLGPDSVTAPQGGNFTLAPLTFNVGLAYRIPFRPRIKRE